MSVMLGRKEKLPVRVHLVDEDTVWRHYECLPAGCMYLKPPQRSWIKPGKCVVMDCDGPKHAFAVDLDGSLTGLGERSSIVARAEFMNERRADPEQFTWYNIPWKMLLDPAPLNDRTDPGWDMSAYHEFAGPGFQFTYRRLAEEEAAEGDGDAVAPSLLPAEKSSPRAAAP